MAASTYTVQRSTVVRASAPEIYPHVADFHRWTAWSPWEGLDPHLRRDYSGAEAGVGAVYAWSGNRKAGQGRMEIVDVDGSNRVTVALRFEKPFRSSSETTFLFEPDGADTRVTWRMVGPRTVATRVMGLFTSMDELVGPDFEKGLERLRTVAEAPRPA